MNSLFYKQNVLVTGGTGMIGRALIDMLQKRGANVFSASLDNASIENVVCLNTDLTIKDNCLKICEGMHYIFHLAGIKGSPKMAAEKPASFAFPMILFNTNMMEAARLTNPKWYLYTSSIGVYHPVNILKEEDVWKTFPSPFDKFAGWAKRIGELQAEAYKIEFGMDNISIVRPANVYGPYDNFNPATSMVVSALIARVFSGENPLKVWGDGSQVRDFIYSYDVAENMIKCVENQVTEPINIGTGTKRTIKELAQIIVDYSDLDVEIEWDTSKPSGDPVRVMDTTRMEKYGLKVDNSLEDGVFATMDWYKANSDFKRYDPFE
tara:strand:+ start:5095 stop:6060 length:966 start_codon:yes stop_codon:yes gene_type:complete